MPILIMALIALATFVAIVGMVCFAGLAEERELRRLERNPDLAGQPAADRRSAA
jgi:ABC-type lipoprotein release transport system permease subunit